jgi:penicillin-binding protein 2
VFLCDRQNGKGTAHGTIDVEHAIERSCDVFFYTVASMMKIDTIHKYAEMLGLAGKTGIDLPNEVDSIVPSTEWKARLAAAMHRPPSEGKWYPGDTISVGIGQGYVSVTPISLAVMVSSIANGGAVVTPHVVKAVDLGQGWTNLSTQPPKTLFSIPPEVGGPVRQGMWLAVNGAGTASALRVVGHDLSGKTGTAQVTSEEKRKDTAGKTQANLQPNAWFEFFAPRDDAEVAGAIMVEHGGYGAEAAVPIAKFVLDTYFAKKEGRPLPVWPKPQSASAPVKTQAPQ